MSRIYVASSWRNAEQPQLVRDLRFNGHEVYDFREPTPGATGFAWSQVCHADPKTWGAAGTRLALLTDPICATGYLSDLRAMEAADTCILLLPSGRSAHIEAGYMKGRGKRLIIWLAGDEPDLMHLLGDELCVSKAEVLAACGGDVRPRKDYGDMRGAGGHGFA